MSTNGTKYTISFKPPSETTTFVIGGQSIEVPALTLWAMENVKDELLALGPDLDFIAYARNVVRIVFKLLKMSHGADIDFEEQDMMKACSVEEMRQLAPTMNRLLGISGFDAGPTNQDRIAEEAAASASGPGTSTNLSLDSPPTESVAETSTG